MAVKLRVGELARNHGLTISALAKRAGVAYNTAHSLYTARATRIDLVTLDRIAAALEVEPGEVFDRHSMYQAGTTADVSTEARMEPIRIGQRVRVIDARLVHYRQAGTVVALHETEGCYVHLDYDNNRPAARIFFHAEELEAAQAGRALPEHQPPSSTEDAPVQRGEQTTPAQALLDPHA